MSDFATLDDCVCESCGEFTCRSNCQLRRTDRRFALSSLMHFLAREVETAVHSARLERERYFPTLSTFQAHLDAGEQHALRRLHLALWAQGYSASQARYFGRKCSRYGSRGLPGEEEDDTDSNQFPKSCGCGAHYDRQSWNQLPLVGETDYAGELLQLRNCACRSTLAVVVA